MSADSRLPSTGSRPHRWTPKRSWSAERIFKGGPIPRMPSPFPCPVPGCPEGHHRDVSQMARPPPVTLARAATRQTLDGLPLQPSQARRSRHHQCVDGQCSEDGNKERCGKHQLDSLRDVTHPQVSLTAAELEVTGGRGGRAAATRVPGHGRRTPRLGRYVKFCSYWGVQAIENEWVYRDSWLGHACLCRPAADHGDRRTGATPVNPPQPPSAQRRRWWSGGRHQQRQLVGPPASPLARDVTLPERASGGLR